MKNKMKKNFLIVGFLILTFILGAKGQVNNFIINNAYYPFSYPGSYMCLTRFDGRKKPLKPLEIHHIGGKGIIDLFRIEPTRGGRVISDAKYFMHPEKYVITSGRDSIEICFESSKIIRIRATNLGIHFTMKHRGQFMPITQSQGRILVYDISKYYKFIITALHGQMKPNKANPDEIMMFYNNLTWDIAESKNSELILEEYLSEWQPRSYSKNFDSCASEASQNFNALYSKMPNVPAEFKHSAMEALYLNWSHIVEKRNFITREAIYMSKTWMPNIWSWDHCFNAIAMSYFDPKLAWDNMMVVFDNQDEIGCLPDQINDMKADWLATKVPIHGWAIKQMMQIGGVINNNRLSEIYEPLSKWTNFYLNYRDDDNNGIPQQNHGNEAADNATVYDKGVPVESPDLCTHLIYQMDMLAEIAGKLGKRSDSVIWKYKADKLQKLMIDQLWNGQTFVYRISGTKITSDMPNCFLPYMPIVISYRLPKNINDKLLAGIEKNLLTPWGIASESPKSPLYISEGYWRGPIWAPVVHLMVTGIENAGNKDLAKKVAYSFCKTVNENGFAENFDAVTGEGLFDPSYTWTSSVFLALLFEYFSK
jgi:putative isomerase